MAVLMLLEIPGATLDRYDRMNDAMGISGDADAPDGLIQHVAGADGDTLVICDVWESDDAGRRFSQERLRPAMADQGIEPSGRPRLLPVHNMLRGSGANAGVLILIEIEGMGSDAYDQMVGKMDAHVADGSGHPSYSHVAATTTEGGMLVADVWESPDVFGEFAQSQIGPAGAEVGLGPIEPRMVPVHNVIRGAGG
jgi:hypothetical protein